MNTVIKHCTRCTTAYELRRGRGRPRDYCTDACRAATRADRARLVYSVRALLPALPAGCVVVTPSGRHLTA